MLRRHVAALALAGSLLPVACSDDGGVGRPADSRTPSAAASSTDPGDGQERSITGEPVDLPPAPVGGFDPPVIVRFDSAPALRAEVARRPDQRSRGLMQRRTLPDGTGMAFLFPGRSRGGFYMLGTLLPLSIAYVDGDRVVSTAEMEPCPGQTCPTYPPEGAYTMAVEAPAGFFPAHGVKAGTKVRIEGETAPAT